MKIRFFESDSFSSLAVAVFATAVAVTCAAGKQGSSAQTAARQSPNPAASPTPAASPAPEASVAPSATEPVTKPKAPAGALPLPTFFSALRTLERGEKKTPVRVLWLGDSHTAADYWVHPVRTRLAKRFGNGGPGFVQFGMEPYHHGGLKVLSEGKWKKEPPSPAGSMKQLDGQFGLGGIRMIPGGQDARSTIELFDGAVDGGARWELLYRTPNAGDRVRFQIRGGKSVTGDAKSGHAGPMGSSIRRVALESNARATAEIGIESGTPQLFGVFIESQTPGIVIDTLGVNGARAATPLAWDETAWIAEARARAPSLFIFAYGTNEAASTLPATRFSANLVALVERARAAAPEADCLVIGPPDMASQDGKSAPRIVEHEAAAREAAKKTGCGYFSAFDAMGGEGSFARWMNETPKLAMKDRVHLQVAGYEKIGALIGDAILSSYSAR